jgi:iron complex outermembrane recepter protein
MSISRANLFLSSVALSMLALPAIASAQEKVSALEEVVVTAERREETAQRSSLAIEVFSAEELQGVSQTQQLTQLTPGIQIGTGGPHPQIYIRGVGDNAANSRSQSAVAFNIDGVYVARGSSISPSFFDLQRVEVLKGPQGTLYGRNASGGAVNILSNGPKLGEFGGYVGADLGNYQLLKFNGAVNIPLGDTFAVRAAFQTIDRDGYLSDGAADQKTQAVRVRALWAPSDAVSLQGTVEVSHIGGKGSGVGLLPAQGDPWRTNTQQPLLYPFSFNAATAPYTTPNDRFIEGDLVNVGAELNWNLGFVTLTVIPAVRLQDQQYVAYSNTFRFYEDLDNQQTTLEARLSNTTDRLKWVAGAYVFEEQSDIFFAPTQNNLNAVVFGQEIKAWALFGQGTLSVTERFRLIGGLRYTNESTGGAFTQGTGAPPVYAFRPTFAPVMVKDIESNATNWKVGAEFDLTDASMLFLTAATGFKGGGFDQTVACGANPFAPEELTAIEFGSRNRFLDNSLQVNLEVFHWKYEGQQVAAQAIDVCGASTRLTFNVGDATIQGANLDIRWRFTPADTVRFAVEYADGTYDRFAFRQAGGAGAFAPARASRCTATPATGTFFNINCSGQSIPRVPEWSGSASYDHDFELSNGATLTAGLSAQFASERWLDFAYQPNGLAPEYVTYDAELTYAAPGETWSVTGWIENIGEEPVYTTGSNIVPLSPNGFNYYTVTIGPPRTYGVRLRANF